MLRFIIVLFCCFLIPACESAKEKYARQVSITASCETGVSLNALMSVRTNCEGKKRADVYAKLGKPVKTYEGIGSISKKKIILEVHQGRGAMTTESDHFKDLWGNKKKDTNFVCYTLELSYYPNEDTVVGCSATYPSE